MKIPVNVLAAWRQILVAILAFGALTPAHAIPTFIVNGGFESGFSGWTRADQIGSDGTFGIQSDADSVTVATGQPVPPSPEGSNAAMTDAGGPGSHVLYQDFVVGSGPYLLGFDLFIGNRDLDSQFYAGPGLDFSATFQDGSFNLNQQARVDILAVGSDPFSIGDVQLNLFQTNAGDTIILDAYQSFAIDLTAFLAPRVGQTLRLRFAEVDNVNIFNFGVDNVRFETGTSVPEPSTTLLLGAAAIAIAVSRRRAQPRAASR